MILTPAADGTLAIDMTDLHGKQPAHGHAARCRARQRTAAAHRSGSSHHRSRTPPNHSGSASPISTAKSFRIPTRAFQGKVVLVNITGSWCPNCHDEAPFLAELYRKYRSQGLEVVALSFEEDDQLKNPARLRAFMKEYGIEYTVLLGGTPDDRDAKLTQPVNLNSWPTTFFLGRDGRVRFVHAGFPGPASGALYHQAVKEFYAQVDSLLAENRTTSTR